MSKVRVAAFSISLDGFGAGPRQDLQNPLGVRGMELHGWFFPTDTFKKMTGHPGEKTAREMGHPPGVHWWRWLGGQECPPHIIEYQALASRGTSGAFSNAGSSGRSRRPKMASAMSLKIVRRFSATTFSQANFPIMGK
jgi:hypothetical protein